MNYWSSSQSSVYWLFGLIHQRIYSLTKEIKFVSICRHSYHFAKKFLKSPLILEVAELNGTQPGDFILRDGTLRPLQVKQSYLVQLGKYLHEKGVRIVAITKQSPIKMELSYTFKQIDSYLQDQLKPTYPFVEEDPKRKKLCCWFEVPSPVLSAAYQGEMFIKKAIHGGRGFGLFAAARLDYVEKLQNYDWVIVDVNIFDAIPSIEKGQFDRDKSMLAFIFQRVDTVDPRTLYFRLSLSISGSSQLYFSQERLQRRNN